MMKTLLTIAFLGITTISNAEILSFPSFQLEVDDGWTHSVESGQQVQDEMGKLIIFYHPVGNGILKIQRYIAPDFVRRDRLRNMTNLDSSTQLTWQGWGDYSGFQHDYSEEGSFYRQWWLANERTIILIVYEGTTESTDVEIDQINKIVNSIKASTP